MDSLPIGHIKPPRVQLRLVDKESVEYMELAAAIGRDGVLQPILVRPVGDGWYEIIDGMNRWTGAAECGLEVIPATIHPCSDFEAMVLTLKLNALVIETKPCDYATHLRKLLKSDPQMKMSRLAKMISKSPKWVDNVLGLTELPDEVRWSIDRGEIPLQSAYLLGKMPPRLVTQYVPRAKSLPAVQFRPLAQHALRQYRDEVRMGRLERHFPESFQPRSWMRTLRVVRKERETDTAAAEVLLRLNAVTPLDGWRAAIDWVLNSDPVAIEKQKAEFARSQR